MPSERSIRAKRDNCSYDLHVHLAAAAGGDGPMIGFDSESVKQLSRPNQSVAFVGAGILQLTLLIEATTDPPARMDREARRRQAAAYKALALPDEARASIFLTHAMARMTAATADAAEGRERQVQVGRVLSQTFPLPPEDAAYLEPRVRSDGAAEGALAELAWYALSLVLGDERASTLPAFVGVEGYGTEPTGSAYNDGGVHAHMAGILFSISWKQGLQHYLSLTDMQRAAEQASTT